MEARQVGRGPGPHDEVVVAVRPAGRVCMAATGGLAAGAGADGEGAGQGEARGRELGGDAAKTARIEVCGPP